MAVALIVIDVETLLSGIPANSSSMLPADDQEQLLARVADALQPGGVLLVREADASAGWTFTMVRFGNRLKALAVGRWRQTFCFRSQDQWAALLRRHAQSRPGPATPASTLSISGVLRSAAIQVSISSL